MGLIFQSIVTCFFVTYVHGLEFRFPSNNTCIIAQMDVSFTINNGKEFNKLKEPQLDENNSMCGNGSTATLALKWKETNDTMTITFIKGVEKVTMLSIYGFIPANHFKDSKNNTLIEMVGPKNTLSMSNMSYKCDSPQNLKFVKDIYQLVMSVAKVQVQAFEVENGNFSNYEECSEDSLTTENPAPETTTPRSQTTTGSLTTVNPPSEYKYMYPSDNPCIILLSAIQLGITYINGKKATVTAKVNIPNHVEAKPTGQCAVNDTGKAFIMLNWKYKTSSMFSLKMDFIADKEAKLNKMEVTGVMSQTDFPDLPDKSKNVSSMGSLDSFESSNLTYYICNSIQEVQLDNVTTVMIDKIQVQAFGVNKTFTGDGTECSQDVSTEKPITSTIPTNTTTGHNTTSNEPTTISTPASTAPISTTAAPLHPTNNYSVHDGNITCVYFVAGMDFTFSYNTTNGTKTVLISVPQNFKTNGTCSKQNETVNETFNELNIYFYNSWNLIFVFAPDNSSSQLGDMQFKTYSVKSITLKYKMDPILFPGSNDTQMYDATANITGSLFQSKVNGSYKCNVDTVVPFSGNIKLKTYNLQYKAFNQDNSTNFGGELSECSGDNSNDNKTNSVVPIAVGAALAGLVVIVLIAYLIGRRRNRKGYESV